MAERFEDQITLPLLDRLVDDDPKRSEEAPISRAQALRELKAAVRRDLEWLLNTRRVFDYDLPEQVSKSVLYFGLPEYANLGESRELVFRELARVMQETITMYEPRLAGIKVEYAPDQDTATRRVSLTIEGLLRIDPGSELVSFDTSLDLTNGSYEVKGDEGA